jgi:hypothetical protein
MSIMGCNCWSAKVRNPSAAAPHDLPARTFCKFRGQLSLKSKALHKPSTIEAALIIALAALGESA